MRRYATPGKHWQCRTRDAMSFVMEDAKPQSKPADPVEKSVPKPVAKEIGGPKGPEPTRYGDWEVGGRCTDF